MSNVEATSSQQRCFVVMGFGIKTDYATGRKLDLDKSYRLLIKPVVEAKGLECIRVDEMRHSGTIDVPMYRELLTADIVVADLSTANPNSFYELGIRHALRPRTTIVISEDKLPYPFDLNHVVITKYTHLGEAIDYEEVERFRQVLGNNIDAVLLDQRTDSPVYTFLNQLIPPSLDNRAAQPVSQTMEQAGDAISEVITDIRTSETVQQESMLSMPLSMPLSMLIEQGEQAIKNSRFSEAKTLFSAALRIGIPDAGAIMHDPYLVRRLSLATYKTKEPDEVSALKEALSTLEPLHPADSNDPETVGLLGAIEKRLFENDQGEEHLSRAIQYYARGYFLRKDRYNGINLAYLLNVRADTQLDATEEDKIADVVWANRIRREVLELCDEDLREMDKRKARVMKEPAKLLQGQEVQDREQEFWYLARKAEALFGLGELKQYENTRSEAQGIEHADWMMECFEEQIKKLRDLLEKHSRLLNPPWPKQAA